MRLILLGLVALMGCAPCGAASSGPVSVQADPAPAHTYWAPEGSVIRNQPTNPGIWVAEDLRGERLAYYFGDACGAAERQGWVGQSRSALPELTPSRLVRVI